MRAKNFFNKFFIILILSLFPIEGASGGSGGGGGRIITPYLQDDEITERKINENRDFARKNAMIWKVKIRRSRNDFFDQIDNATDELIPPEETAKTEYVVRVRSFSLKYLNKTGERGEPEYKFEGQTEKGEIVSIEFSELERFKIIKIENNLFSKDQAIVEIIQFPTISAKRLLEEKPTYTQLKQKYSKSWKLRIDLENDEGKELYVTGCFTNDGKCIVVKKFRDMDQHTIPMHYPQLPPKYFWWAIPSVADDKSYPHRLITLK